MAEATVDPKCFCTACGWTGVESETLQQDSGNTICPLCGNADIGYELDGDEEG